MAYITGTAASLADLKTAIENVCTANGWALADGILSKNGAFFKLTANAGTYPSLVLNGGTSKTGSTLNGQPTQPQANAGVMIGSPNGNTIVFPINYEIYLFTDPDEVYCVINYNSDFYQQLSFGKSDIPGIGGAAAWFTGSMGTGNSLTSTSGSRVYMSSSQNNCGTTPYNGLACGLWFEQSTAGSYHSSFVHSNLDGISNWRCTNNATVGTGGYGISYAASLLGSLPNLSNQATILLPVKAIIFRNDAGRTIAANPKNVRYLRIDNVVPGEIVTFGADQWKVYPFHRKDSTQRNGVSWSTGAQHSGTWGYAIKYTGS